MTEAWKPVPNYSNYEASDQGRVRNIRTGRVLALTPMHAGYLMVHLSHKGIAKWLRVQRVILATFKGVAPAGMHARHLNGNKLDNRLCNLEWGTV